MKKITALLIFIFSVQCHTMELAYSSYSGSLGNDSAPVVSEAPLYKVQDTTAFPFRTVGRLETGCTATLIGAKEILTAAHCVYSVKDNEYYNELDFSPAQNGNTYPFGTIAWEKVRAPTQWTEEHNDDYDFALITLKENIGDTLGWLGMKVETSPYNKPIQISGYAGKKTFGTLWKSSCDLLSPNPKWLDYECETQGGMSGSSVVLLDKAKANYQVIGVHALGGLEYNSGVRITAAVYKMILSWK